MGDVLFRLICTGVRKHLLIFPFYSSIMRALVRIEESQRHQANCLEKGPSLAQLTFQNVIIAFIDSASWVHTYKKINKQTKLSFKTQQATERKFLYEIEY